MPVLKKQLLLNTARQLMVKSSFQDFTLDKLAHQAGVAKGTVFLYYSNKDELFSAVFQKLIDELGKDLDAVLSSERSGSELLVETIRTILTHFERNRDFMAHFSLGRFPSCGPTSSGKLMGRFGKNSIRIQAILKKCERDGLIRSRDLSYEAFALIGMCRSALVEKIVRGGKAPLTQKTERIAEIFLNGVGKK